MGAECVRLGEPGGPAEVRDAGGLQVVREYRDGRGGEGGEGGEGSAGESHRADGPLFKSLRGRGFE